MMNGITKPITFANIELMNQYYSEFEKKAIQICSKYYVSELWENAKILKDDKQLKLSIISLGTYGKGTNTEKAVNEIIEAFENLFNK